MPSHERPRGSTPPRRHLASSFAVARTSLADPVLRRLQLAWTAATAGEALSVVALGVYAYEVGGASAVGLVAVVQMASASACGPACALLGDRYRRERVLAGAAALAALSLAAATVAAAVQAPPVLVFVLAAVLAVATGATYPAQAALVPLLARSVGEVTAATATAGCCERVRARGAGRRRAGAARRARPDGPRPRRGGLPDGHRAGAQAAAHGRRARAPDDDRRLARHGRRLPGRRQRPSHRPGPRHPGRAQRRQGRPGDAARRPAGRAAGPRQLRRRPAARRARGRRAAGRPGSGSARRPPPPGRADGPGARPRRAPLLLAAALPATAVVVGAVVVVGAGFALVSVAGTSLLVRAVRDDVLSRVLGVLQPCAPRAWPPAPASLHRRSAPSGCAGPWRRPGRGSGWCCSPWVPACGRRRGVEGPRPPVALLRGAPVFAPLPPVALERLASRLYPVQATAGTAAVQEGDEAEEVYLVDDGELAVEAAEAGGSVDRIGPGEVFGEMALLHGAPRNATVRAVSDRALDRLTREEFLVAVTGSPESAVRAQDLVATRLEHRRRLVDGAGLSGTAPGSTMERGSQRGPGWGVLARVDVHVERTDGRATEAVLVKQGQHQRGHQAEGDTAPLLWRPGRELTALCVRQEQRLGGVQHRLSRRSRNAGPRPALPSPSESAPVKMLPSPCRRQARAVPASRSGNDSSGERPPGADSDDRYRSALRWTASSAPAYTPSLAR